MPVEEISANGEQCLNWLSQPRGQAQRVTLMADLRYEGGRYFQNDGGRFGHATNFAAMGFGGTTRLYRQVELQAGVQNALDRNYLLVDGYPEAGRTVYVNLRYRF